MIPELPSEVVEARKRRRRRSWSADEKRKIVAESWGPGASVSQVAQRYDLNANQLFTWRRQLRTRSACASADAVELVPVTISPQPLAVGGRMELALVGGERISFGADVDAVALARVVKALSRR